MKNVVRCHNIHWLPALIALVGMATTLPVQARSLVEITQSHEIRICLVPDIYILVEPPDCRDNCIFSGPIYEEVLAFANTLGKEVQPKFIRIEWNEQFFNHEGQVDFDAVYTPELLASGKCDLFPTNLTRMEWRARKMDFVTLFPNRMMVMIHKTKKEIFKSAADLAGKSAAIEEATSYYTWVQEQNQTVYATAPVKIEPVGSDDEAIEAVEFGKVDFTLLDADRALWLARHRLKDTVVAFPVGPADEIGWAFRKEDQDLQSAVQAFFEEQRAETSTFNKIWETHFGITLNKFISIIKATQ